MTFRDYLASAHLLNDEGEHVEFKAAQGGVPKNVWESVSAFANTSGGRILLGVDRAGRVRGLPNPDQIQSDIGSALHQTLTPSIQVSVTNVEVDEGRFVEFHVPEAEPYLKPVYITARGIKTGAYKRVGSSDIQLSNEDLTRIAAARSGMSPDQATPAEAALSDIDPTLIQQYRRRLRSNRPTSPLLAFDDTELLRGLNLIVGEDGSDRPNRAGILLFGRDSSIQRIFPGFAFQILEIDGTEWIPSPDVRPRTLTLPTTGLVELASRIADELMGRIPEGVRFSSRSFHREADPVHVAIREGVVNALIHQDYLALRPTQFRRFSDRLEIENPGTSKKPLSDFDRPGSSPRNPLVARAFNVVGLAERVGSGILTMKSGFRNAGLAEPVFENDERGRQFRVAFYWHNLATTDQIHRVAELEGLNEDERRTVVFAVQTGRVDNNNVRELTGRNIVRASETLRRLVDLGLLERHGGGRATFYTPTSVIADSDAAQATLKVQFSTGSDSRGPS